MDSHERDEQQSRRLGIGRGNRAWLQHDNKALRRPHPAESGSNQCSAGSSLSADTLEEKKSSLSPQAAEFVPRYVQQQQQQQQQLQTSPSPHIAELAKEISKISVQDRIRIARETPPNVHVSQFLTETRRQNLYDMPQQCDAQDSEIGNYDDKMGQDYQNDNKANDVEEIYNYEILKQLDSIIKTLTRDPGEFTLVSRFLNKLKFNLMDEMDYYCLQMIVATIMESAMTESNFLYNGARFCKHLDTSLNADSAAYKELLYCQCKLQIHLQELNWQKEGQRDQKKCNGLILFLAELVAQMDESYAFRIGELLVRFISKVLLKPASNSVKHICQALKLAGRIMERDQNIKEEMENMMRALTELVNNGQVDTYVGNMVNRVHELRKNWGESSETNDVSSNNDIQQQQSPQQPSASTCDLTTETDAALSRERNERLHLTVMFGPDGKALTAEEVQFLLEHLPTEPDDEETSNETSDDTYDDEIALAYEEFLKEKPT